MNYKILFVPVIGGPHYFEKKFATHAEAEAALESIAEYTLMLHEWNLMFGFSNKGAIFKKDEDGDWREIDGGGEEI